MALTLEYFWKRVLKDDKSGCWIWMGRKGASGYGVMSYGHSGRIPAHRWALETFHGKQIQKGYDCCHSCDVRLCVNPAHLFVGTRSENMKDCGRKGRHWTQNPKHKLKVMAVTKLATRASLPKLNGTANHLSKINADQLLEIRRLLKQNKTCAEIGRTFGLNRSTISHIKLGKSYRLKKSKATT